MDRLELGDTYVKVNGQPLHTVTDLKIHCSSDERYAHVVITLDADVSCDCKAEIETQQDSAWPW